MRSLAVELVDGVIGHAVEFSNQPNVHEGLYDWAEERLTAEHERLLYEIGLLRGSLGIIAEGDGDAKRFAAEVLRIVPSRPATTAREAQP